jgi:hypothetical protein
VTKSDSTLALTNPSDADVTVVELSTECGLPLRRYVGSFGIGVPDTEDVVRVTRRRGLTDGGPLRALPEAVSGYKTP